ncbi:hypothetical protein [Streptomyces sp. V3I7]|uniref:hypothetical protein n=1 Tax=Streptomyces sp. V3I7 TaxID=3042278 RepID=UPI0027817F06|nr:hypothetical protein [Streptomyces sp. V3I7]MDQ0994817.1 nucleotide-binding universal stress UspA family protein [Streptomyces sp. V3I7]
MSSPTLTISTPSGTVRATAGERQGDAVVFELSGAMRGPVHVTGTHHPHQWDQFTAVRACLGPIDAVQDCAPDDALPRFRNSRSGYRGSVTLYQDNVEGPQEMTSPLQSAAGYPPAPRSAATLTAALRACAEAVTLRADLAAILDASRARETPGLLRFFDESASRDEAEAARYEAEAQAAQRARRAAVAAWWTVAGWAVRSPHPVLLLLLADVPESLAHRVAMAQWWGPYCLDQAERERERVRRTRAEAASLRAQRRGRPQPSAGVRGAVA